MPRRTAQPEPRRAEPTPAPRMPAVAPIVLIVAAVALAYGRAATFDFVSWDDFDYVRDNPALRLSLPDLVRELCAGPVPRAHGDFLPLTLLSYWLDFRLAGAAPRLYHLTNVVLHAAAAVLLFVLVRAMLRATAPNPHPAPRAAGDASPPSSAAVIPALLVALLWALHPLNTEAVTWVSERKSVLAMTLLLAALTALWRGTRCHRMHAGWVSAALALYVLACASKSAVVFAPLVAAAMLWLLRRCPPQRIALIVLPWALPAVLAAWGRVAGHRLSGQAAFDPFGGSAAVHALTVLRNLGRYALKALWPARLNNLYSLDTAGSAADPLVWLGAAVILACLAGAWLLRRRAPLVALGLVWFLAGWLPHSQLRPIPPALFADRYLYFALPGLALVTVCAALRAIAVNMPAPAIHRSESPGLGMPPGQAVARATTPRRVEDPPYGLLRAAAVGCAVVLLVALGGATCARNGVWRDSLSLWTDCVAKNPDSPLANSHLGMALLGAGRRTEAAERFEHALTGNPTELMALSGLASVRAESGDPVGAVALLRRAVAAHPERIESWMNLGLYALHARLHDEAIAAYRRARELAPASAPAASGLAAALNAAGRFSDARNALRDALELDPDDALAIGQMGVIHANLGQWAEAERWLAEAHRRTPENPQIADYLRRVREQLDPRDGE